MAARRLRFGFRSGILTLVLVGVGALPAAEAAFLRGSFAGWPYHNPQVQPVLRRVSAYPNRGGPNLSLVRPVYSSLGPRRVHGAWSHRKGKEPAFVDGRAGARKAVPVTRGQELGLRFRPDERESPYGQSAASRPGSGGDAHDSELQSQFRPTERRRKQTYEELQAERAAPAPMQGPVSPYPMLPPPLLPGYPSYWPN